MIRDLIKGKRQALSNSPKSIGIGGFLLFARVSEGVSYKSTVPNYTLEDGSNAADDIIRDPLTVTINGIVADNYIALAETPKIVSDVKNLSGKIEVFLPNRTQAQLSQVKAIGVTVLDAVDKLDSYIDVATSAYNLVSGGDTSKGLRERFIDYIEAVYFSKQLIDVDVEYRTHTSMAITSLDLRADNKTDETAFEIAFQQVNIKQAIYVDISEFYKNPSPASKDGVAGKSDKGVQNAKGGKEKSLASALLGR